MSVKYKSTRGRQKGLSFEEVVLGGLAVDRGLYVPEQIPIFTSDQLENVIFIIYYIYIIHAQVSNNSFF